jgi:hypothetical protein
MSTAVNGGPVFTHRVPLEQTAQEFADATANPRFLYDLRHDEILLAGKMPVEPPERDPRLFDYPVDTDPSSGSSTARRATA